MTAILILHVAIDDSRPLGPQIAAARAEGVPWKVLEDKLRLSERHMRNLMAVWIETWRRVPKNRNDKRRAIG